MATIMLRHTMGPKVLLSFQLGNQSSKAELPLEGIFFPPQFPSLGIFINKRVGNQKN